MHFSFSTLNMLRTHSHCWINKTLGIKQQDQVWFREGREGHDIIQKHVSGAKKDERIAYLTEEFPIVETKPFDEKCKFEFEFMGYKIIGFLDGRNYENRKFLEIKLSSTPWSIGKFQKAEQRKIYALAEPYFQHAVLITGSRDPRDWSTNKLKVYQVENTDADREAAKKWLAEGIAIFEEGDFTGGLDEEGRCTDPWCPWGKNCHFKQL